MAAVSEVSHSLVSAPVAAADVKLFDDLMEANAIFVSQADGEIDPAGEGDSKTIAYKYLDFYIPQAFLDAVSLAFRLQNPPKLSPHRS
ncbi:hypothetical protein BV25DRAFT_1827556 [Artomyces pyxidatus]|uniref:Uncharacterized protein n=1 Tax=Artomyces pyxidatus TaxID=48021 RepID=A0ACB8SW15_9AGAM|nr:hypothetical protein BV25DRAFT_1827556 [Artomyces pyxidatus]